MIEQKLESTITECPHCQTRFRVTDLQLKAAAGRVRCGSCLNVFQGARHVVPAHVPEPAPRRTATVRHLYGGHEERPPEPDEPPQAIDARDTADAAAPFGKEKGKEEGKEEGEEKGEETSAPEAAESATATAESPPMEVPKALK